MHRDAGRAVRDTSGGRDAERNTGATGDGITDAGLWDEHRYERGGKHGHEHSCEHSRYHGHRGRERAGGHSESNGDADASWAR